MSQVDESTAGVATTSSEHETSSTKKFCAGGPLQYPFGGPSPNPVAIWPYSASLFNIDPVEAFKYTKRALDIEFKDRYPTVLIKYSLIEAMKRDILSVPEQCTRLEKPIVARSYVYFEKMILAGMVTEANCTLFAASSLLTSARLDDVKERDMEILLMDLKRIFQRSRYMIMATENAIVQALDYDLFPKLHELQPHYVRLNYQP